MYWIDEVQLQLLSRSNIFKIEVDFFFFPWTSEFRILWRAWLPMLRNYLWRDLIPWGKQTYTSYMEQTLYTSTSDNQRDLRGLQVSLSAVQPRFCLRWLQALQLPLWWAALPQRSATKQSHSLPQLFLHQHFSVKVQIHAEEISEKALGFPRL